MGKLGLWQTDSINKVWMICRIIEDLEAEDLLSNADGKWSAWGDLSIHDFLEQCQELANDGKFWAGLPENLKSKPLTQKQRAVLKALGFTPTETDEPRPTTELRESLRFFLTICDQNVPGGT